MAVKVLNETVIDDSRVLQNIAGANGTFDNLQPNLTIMSGSIISFNNPVSYKAMTSNLTFTVTGVVANRSVLFLLDRSITEYTPTFGSDFKWAGGTEPTWADYRFWQITLTWISAGVIRASAGGYESTATGVTETVSLSGTEAGPNIYFGNLHSFSGAGYGFVLTSSGNINSYDENRSPTIQLFRSNEWNNTTPSQTYYVKATIVQTLLGQGGGGNVGGDVLSTFLPLSSDRYFYFSDSRAPNSFGYSYITWKFEIATDSGGTNIIATGHYRATYEGGA